MSAIPPAFADTGVVGMPINATPFDGTHLVATSTVSLSWLAATDASSSPVTYDYEVSTSASANADGSFQTTVLNGSGLTGTNVDLTVSATGLYWWHVRAHDALGNVGAWSNFTAFTVDSLSTSGSGSGTGTTTGSTGGAGSTTGSTGGSGSTSTTTLPWPGNIWPYNGVVITSAAFTHVEWTKDEPDGVTLPVTYNYEVSHSNAVNADGSFVSPIFSATNIATTTLATPGTPEGVYYWHVQAVDGAGDHSGWSTYSKVTVDNSATGSGGLGLGSAPVGTSTAIYPNDGAIITQSQDTHVDWTDASGTQPLNYVYQYSWSTQTEANGDLTFPSFTSGTLASSSFTVWHPQGDAPGVYHWHVRAIDPSGNVGPWSDLFTFTVVADGSSTGTTTGSTTPSTATSTNATTTQMFVITPNDLIGTTSIPAAIGSDLWFFYNDLTDAIDNSLGSFVTGPGNPPLGTGSAQMTASSTDRVNLATFRFRGVKLADIMQLVFSTFAHDQGNGTTSSTTPTLGADPYLQFNVDFNGSNTWQHRLAFVPRLNGTVSTSTWQTWDAINGGNGEWVYSGVLWPGTLTPGTTPMTWSQINAAYPNAGILASNPFLGFRVGEPYPNGFTGNVDNFQIGLRDATTTGSGSSTMTMATTSISIFDFDPATTTATSTGTTTSNTGGGGGGGGGTSGQFSSGGGGGSSGGSVLGASTGPTTEVPATIGSFFPTGSVLGASTVAPGIPNTGEGGNALVNTLILTLAGMVIAAGISLLAAGRRERDTDAFA